MLTVTLNGKFGYLGNILSELLIRETDKNVTSSINNLIRKLRSSRQSVRVSEYKWDKSWCYTPLFSEFSGLIYEANSIVCLPPDLELPRKKGHASGQPDQGDGGESIPYHI